MVCAVLAFSLYQSLTSASYRLVSVLDPRDTKMGNTRALPSKVTWRATPFLLFNGRLQSTAFRHTGLTICLCIRPLKLTVMQLSYMAKAPRGPISSSVTCGTRIYLARLSLGLNRGNVCGTLRKMAGAHSLLSEHGSLLLHLQPLNSNNGGSFETPLRWPAKYYFITE